MELIGIIIFTTLLLTGRSFVSKIVQSKKTYSSVIVYNLLFVAVLFLLSYCLLLYITSDSNPINMDGFFFVIWAYASSLIVLGSNFFFNIFYVQKVKREKVANLPDTLSSEPIGKNFFASLTGLIFLIIYVFVGSYLGYFNSLNRYLLHYSGFQNIFLPISFILVFLIGFYLVIGIKKLINQRSHY